VKDVTLQISVIPAPKHELIVTYRGQVLKGASGDFIQSKAGTVTCTFVPTKDNPPQYRTMTMGADGIWRWDEP
jgi:hypothetical protein